MEHGSRSAFQFQYTVHFTEADYAALRLPDRPTRTSTLFPFLVAALGLAALMWSWWTAPLGGLLLAFAALMWSARGLSKKGLRHDYAQARYLHGPTTYGVSEAGFWLEGGPLRVHSAWSGLALWHRWDNWLLLQGHHTPPFYFPVRELDAAGVYDRVMELAREHGAEYGSEALAKKFRLTAA